MTLSELQVGEFLAADKWVLHELAAQGAPGQLGPVRGVRGPLQQRPWPGQISGRTELSGSYLLHLKAPLDRDRQPVEVMGWIRSWGSRVEVLAPAHVRAQWLADAQDLLTKHLLGALPD